MNHKKRSPSGERELRTYTAVKPMTVRTTSDGSKQVSGYAIVFDAPSVDLGGFTEICSLGMLNRTLKENPDCLMLRDHKQELLLGRTTAGTLDLKTDSSGLAFTITLPKTNIGDDTAENVRLGNLTGCSFGFSTVDDTWAELIPGFFDVPSPRGRNAGIACYEKRLIGPAPVSPTDTELFHAVHQASDEIEDRLASRDLQILQRKLAPIRTICRTSLPKHSLC
jgi:HK97 family phage prohead protease